MSDRIAIALTALAEIHQRPISTVQLDLYVSILGSRPEELILKSIRILAAESKYFPKPAEIIAQARSIASEDLQRAPELMAPEMTEEQRVEAQRLIDYTKERLGW